MTDIFSVTTGFCPLVMSIPHLGQKIPEQFAGRMTPEALRVPDTDWDLDKLYDFAQALGAHIIKANFSRYVVDLNRPPDDKPLYPGADNTSLVPVSTFASENIYRPGEAPDANEVDESCRRYWQPYHDALKRMLGDIKARHGIAVLFDCHSIKSRLERFFDGKLPDINLGTADGTSCAPELETLLARELGRNERYTLAVNGRFKGGYITRHFGAPDKQVHAYQIEHATSAYMDEQPWFKYRDDYAKAFQPVLKAAMEQAIAWAKSTNTVSP